MPKLPLDAVPIGKCGREAGKGIDHGRRLLQVKANRMIEAPPLPW
jgi:hypothetical protein